MAGGASLDLRIPIGALFTTLGLIIGGFGVATAQEPNWYVRSGGLNINLWWGLVMLIFGVVMLLAARRGRRGGAMPAQLSPEGRAMEALEHRRGLERE